VLIPLGLVLWIAWRTQRYMTGVVEFMTAGRAAGRYLVCNAVGEAQTGAVTVIAMFEAWYVSGFAFSWWQQMVAPVVLIVSLTGFVIYRYRETRCMTLAEFFEKRYSKNLRIFMGIVAWFSGTFNFAIFPIVGARFFVAFCGFPQETYIGPLHVRTEALAMLILLGGALVVALVGGQMTIMVTDCIEGLVSGVMYLIIAVAILWLFPWSQMSTALSSSQPGLSMLNPFDTWKEPDFNFWYVMISIVGLIYNQMAWQGGHAFRASAANPHEAKMGNTLGIWRVYAKNLMITLLACCAFTFMNHPNYSAGAAWVNKAMAQIPNENIRNSMRIPLALNRLLPVGLKGTFAAIMLFHLIGCDSSYLHSWGSIFVQDVWLPFRKRRNQRGFEAVVPGADARVTSSTPIAEQEVSPQEHFRLLRWSIVLVAIIAYLFGVLFPPTKYILMFFAVTGAIFMGGAGSVIIGGFYWKKGTTAGAYAGMITGSSIAVAGVIVDQLYKDAVVNGQWFYLISMVAAVVVYVVVSWLTCKEEFNLDRVLHRGQWAVKEYGDERLAALPTMDKRSRLQQVLGIDEQFTTADKVQTYTIFVWTMFWLAVFVVFSAWNLVSAWPTSWWAMYWNVVGIWLPLIIGAITTTWFTIGGLRDLRILFRRLDEAKIVGAPGEERTLLPAGPVAGYELTTPIRASDPESLG
jgi:Na+/proline symporter